MSSFGRRQLAVAIVAIAAVFLALHVRFHMTYPRDFKILQVARPEDVSLSVLYRRHPILIYRGADDRDRLERVFAMQYLFHARTGLTPGERWTNRSKFAALTYHPSDVTDDATVTVTAMHPRPGAPSVSIKLDPKTQALVLPLWWKIEVPHAANGSFMVDTFDDFVTRVVSAVT